MAVFRFNYTVSMEKQELINVLLFSFGKAISLFGATIFQFALGFYVLKETGSALSFAVSLLLGTIPTIIINPFAGLLADRCNKKMLTASMELLNGLLFIIVYVVSINEGFHLPLIYTTIFIMTMFTTFYGITLEASKPNIVSEKKLMNINSISKIIDSVSTMVGPIIGGIVFVIINIETFLIINAICFLISGILMLMMDFKLFEHVTDQNDQSSSFHILLELKKGLYYFFHHKKVKNLFVMMVSINFFLGFTITVPLPYILNAVLLVDSKEFGIIQAAFPVGMIVGALFIKKIMKHFTFLHLLNHLSYFLSFLIVLSGIPVILKSVDIQFPHYLFFYIALMFFIGIIIACIDIPLSYIVQNEVPDQYRGRVLGIGISLGKTLLPIAMIVAGLLLNYIPSFVIPLVGGLAYALMHFIISKKINFVHQDEKQTKTNLYYRNGS